jgi:hypothetical protein
MLRATALKIGSTITALINPGRSDAADLLRQLRPGQVLQANVIDSPRAGIARLQIGLTELLAKTQIPLQRGTPLTLSVSRLGNPPELQVLHARYLIDPEQYLLRKSLPQQISLGEALNAIGRTLHHAGNVLPRHIQDEGQLLLNRVIDPSRLSAARVKDQFLNSGLFFEALLARYGRAANGDMKLDIMHLMRGLQALLGAQQAGKPGSALHSPAQLNLAPDGVTDRLLKRLIQLLDGALARIHTHQAISLAQDLPDRSVWQFDLPLLVNGQPDQVLLRVERENHSEQPDRGNREGARWSATLRFDFASTGWIQANLRVQNDRISSTFWCERASTEQLIGAQLPRLEKAMMNAGLQVDALAARHGSPPEQPGLLKPGDALIDDHA